MIILLVEGDARSALFTEKGLIHAGHSVDIFNNGRDAMNQCLENKYDVIVTDFMTTNVDGLSMVRALRASGIQTPTLFLTTPSGIDGRVDGPETGADDYMTKPFAFSEFIARIHALARRPVAAEEDTDYTVGELQIDLVTRKVTRGNVEITLKPREFTLLEVLMRNEGKVVSRAMLLEQVWGFDFEPKTSIIETHISKLKAKVDNPFDDALITTVRNIGYSISPA